MSHVRRRSCPPLTHCVQGGRLGMGEVPLLTEAQGAAAIQIEAQANRVSRTWSPTGFYTPAQVTKVITDLTKVYVSVLAPLTAYEQGYKIDDAGVRQVKDRLARAYAKTIIFQQAALTATSRGFKYIDAPGFKRFVVDFLYTMSGGVSGYVILARNDAAAWQRAARDTFRLLAGPLGTAVADWSGYLNQLSDLMVRVVNAIVAVAGVAVEVIQAAGNVVLKIPDTVGTVIKLAKWGALLFGAGWVYQRVQEQKKGSRK